MKIIADAPIDNIFLLPSIKLRKIIIKKRFFVAEKSVKKSKRFIAQVLMKIFHTYTNN